MITELKASDLSYPFPEKIDYRVPEIDGDVTESVTYYGSPNIWSREKALAHDIERLVEKHGAIWRKLFTDALTWLDERETEWGLEKPMNRDEFVECLMETATPNVQEIYK